MGLTATVSEVKGAQAFLRAIGADWHSKLLIVAVVAWFRQESGSVKGVIGNNPFNIRPGVASSLASGRRRSSGGGWFLVFPDLETGFIAAAKVLMSLAPSYGYGLVIAALKAGRPVDFLVALALSSWDQAHYGGVANAATIGNHLIKLYSQFTGLNFPPAESTSGKKKRKMPKELPVLSAPSYTHEFLDGWAVLRFYRQRHAAAGSTVS